jgi:hypothetical protein
MCPQTWPRSDELPTFSEFFSPAGTTPLTEEAADLVKCTIILVGKHGKLFYEPNVGSRPNLDS